MDPVAPIVTPVVQSLIVVFKKYLDYVVSSAKYVRKMRAKVKELSDTADDMKEKEKRYNRNSLEVPRHLQNWLEEVESIKAKVADIPMGGVGCFNINMRYKAAKQSSDILTDVERLMEENSSMVWTDIQIPLAMVSSPKPSTSALTYDYNQNKNRIESRDLIFDDALKCLESNDKKTQKMALCGMGGVGKTTMMEQLREVARDKKMFDWIVKVVIGQNPNPIAVQTTIAEQTGNPLTETDNETRAERLQKRFEEMSKDGEKKILVILDDVWKEFNVKDIGLTSPLPSGFKLLLTSREEKVCTQMGVGSSSIFKIVNLKEPEARKLFWEIAGLVTDGDIEPDLRQIGEGIVKRCGGLPLAIDIMASALRDNKEKDEWENSLFDLHNKNIPDLIDIFEFSYKNLKEDDLKATFLLSGLFPEDFNIRIEDILRYGWGLKLFKNVHAIETARSRVNAYVNKLIRSNLLIRSDQEGCVKMHDLVRDFVLSNFSKVKQASIVNHDDDVSEQLTEESYDRILLKCTGMFEFPEDFNYPVLAFLKLMDGDGLLKFPEDLYKRMEKLEVVAYENMCQLLLPQYSTSLRTLCLRSCWLANDDISFLGDLINLEVLSFANCGIRKLPSTIGKLKKLKLLDLTGCVDLCIDDGVFQNLDKLSELYMRVSKGKAIKFTAANCDELERLSPKLSGLEVEFFENILQPKNVSFEKLQRFRISMGCLLEKKTDYTADKYSFKNTLKLLANCSQLLECKINELFSKTEELHLSVKDMSHLEHISMHPSKHSTFCNLKVLYVFECADLTHLFTIPVANGLMKLESLSVSSCPVLESIVHASEISGDVVIRFQQLKYLSLNRLPKLVSLCDCVNVMELPQLVDLKLYDLPNVTSIFPENNINISARQPFLNKEAVIPKLENLLIDGMKNLEEIWPCEITSVEEDSVPMLRVIEVRKCESLVNLFPTNPMRLLNYLQKLTVQKCSIEVLFNIDLGGQIEQLSSSSSLRSIYVDGLWKLREVWRIKDAENNNSGLLTCGFQAVESIEIWNCEKFRNIITPPTANFDMRALIDINIRWCGEEIWRNNAELVKNTQEKEINATPEKEISKVVFPSCHLTRTFHQLRNIRLHGFKGVEVVFEIESPCINRECVTQQLPLLEDLLLFNMDTLSHVWKCNWKEFLILHKHQPQYSSFQNLTDISLSDCQSIKYLFSPLMAKLLTNLKIVVIEFCDGMEEVVSNRDEEDEEMTTSTSTTTLFPHLDELILDGLSNLKNIGGGGGVAKGTTNVIDHHKFSQVGVVSWSLCQYPREINICNCNALSSVIPSYAAGQMQKLQVLRIYDCRSMMEVFETKVINNNNVTNFDQGSDTTLPISRLKSIIVHELPNLKILKIMGCDRLENIFTFSTLESLRLLEKLTITRCEAMKVIVREENGEQTTKDVVFPRLKSIKLDGLQNLAGFFLGMNIDFQWPLLDYVMINDCPKMMMFTSGGSTAPKLKYIHTWLGKHNLECGLNFHQTPSPSLDSSSSCLTVAERTPWSFHNLIEMNVKSDSRVTKIIIPSNELRQLQNLEKIHVNRHRYVEEVFEVAESELTNNESQTVVKFPKLREAELKNLKRLKYIWKSNQWFKLEFPNLTRLSFYCCYSLEHVFTPSMVGSLMQLQLLHISNCDKMEVIVKEEEGESDLKVSEIKFPCLKSLKLESLRSLKGFCLAKEDFTLPTLNSLVIKHCPSIMVFTEGRSIVPKQMVVETRIGLFYAAEDINTGESRSRVRDFESAA